MFNFNFLLARKITKIATLNKIKSEYYNRNRISNDVFVDACSAKTLSDHWCAAVYSKLDGYIHEIGLDPFGFLLISDKQVKL